MKYLLVLVLLGFSLIISAQDVIVMKDGATVISKVEEITPTYIKYRKASNLQGPIYSIKLSDVNAINYENGQRDVFADPNHSDINSSSSPSTEISPNNNALIELFNNRQIIYLGQPSSKANAFIGILGITKGSVIETGELRVDFSMKRYITCDYDDELNHITEIGLKSGLGQAIKTETMMLVITLENKTSKALYVDLGNSFMLNNGGSATPLYTNSSTMKSTSTTNGGSVGIGTTIGSFSIGGSVGNASSKSTSTTIYAERIKVIPPKSKVSLEPFGIGMSLDKKNIMMQNPFKSELVSSAVLQMKQLGLIEEDKNYYKLIFSKSKIGETFTLAPAENPSLSFIINYAANENVHDPSSVHFGFYIKQLMGADVIGNGDRIDLKKMDLSQSPLIYVIRGKKLSK